MAVSAVITQRLVDLDRQLQSAGQGQRTALCKAAAAEPGSVAGIAVPQAEGCTGA